MHSCVRSNRSIVGLQTSTTRKPLPIPPTRSRTSIPTPIKWHTSTSSSVQCTATLSSAPTQDVFEIFTAPNQSLRAIVIGSGIAGLLAAHTASKYFDHVLLLEKDTNTIRASIDDETITDTKNRRKSGVPQIVQPHQLIAGGVSAMDALLPGFIDYVVSQGGLDLDAAKDVYYYDFGGVYPREQSSIRVLGVTRRFLEQQLRNVIVSPTLTPEEKKLTVLEGAEVNKLIWKDKAVRGVITKEGSRHYFADVVINATGRKNKISKWLTEGGYEGDKMKQLEVHPHVTSISCYVHMPEGWLDDPTHFKVCLIKDQPFGTRGGSLFPAEQNIWQVTLADIGGFGSSDCQGIDPSWEGLLSFARTLPDQTLANVLEQCTLVPGSTIERYNAMMNYRTCFEELEEWPEGFIALGDCVQALNAVYGQGMSVSAKSVLALERHLEKVLKPATTVAERRWLARKGTVDFQKNVLPPVLLQSWELATGSDLKYATTTVKGDVHGVPKWQMATLESIARVAQRDADVYHRMLEVGHMVNGKGVLLTASPKLVWALTERMFAK